MSSKIILGGDFLNGDRFAAFYYDALEEAGERIRWIDVMNIVDASGVTSEKIIDIHISLATIDKILLKMLFEYHTFRTLDKAMALTINKTLERINQTFEGMVDTNVVKTTDEKVIEYYNSDNIKARIDYFEPGDGVDIGADVNDIIHLLKKHQQTVLRFTDKVSFTH